MILAAAANAAPDYVPRPQGWFLLVPPLTKPKPLTAKQHVDYSAPQERWSAMIIRGRDGRNYDFAGNDVCLAWKTLIGLNLRQDPTIGLHHADTTFALDWLAKSRCVKDNNRHSVITHGDWSEAMKRYFHRSH
jgi:hypothetical protein